MGSKVLLVEDNPSVRELISVLLSSEGYEIVEAEDGRDGLTKARQMHPDLMILDLMMPGVSGEGVIAELQKDPGFESMPVMVVSGKDEGMSEIKDMLGDENVFQKPFEPVRLLNRVVELIGLPNNG
ncbi:MAG TPA: response regulator transcription factor [Actinomycetota bacterium]|nr:response regulator transcription factor [Actinomycetota bacterium]